MTKTQFDFIFVMREKEFRFRDSFSIVNDDKCVYHIEVKRETAQYGIYMPYMGKTD